MNSLQACVTLFSSQCLLQTFGQGFPSTTLACWLHGTAAWVSAVIQETVGLQITSQVEPACIILYKYSGFYNSGNPTNIRKFKQKILEMSEHLLKWISLINAYFRIGKRSPGEASWAAPGPVCGSESHSGIHQKPWVQQTTDSVLSRLVWYRKELCGPDSRGQPVPGWYKEWMCAFVHCPIPLPSREIGGRVQGEQRFNIWRPHSCPGHLIWFSSRLLI